PRGTGQEVGGRPETTADSSAASRLTNRVLLGVGCGGSTSGMRTIHPLSQINAMPSGRVYAPKDDARWKLSPTVYSDLSTTFGSSRDARHAGKEHATPAITAIVGIAIAN